MAILVLTTALESSVPRLYLMSVVSFFDLLIVMSWLSVSEEEICPGRWIGLRLIGLQHVEGPVTQMLFCIEEIFTL